MNDIKNIDVAVIGGGPAGMTAALYAARAGRDVVMFEHMLPGGQMGNTTRIDNYPGFPEGVNGFELGMKMSEQAKRFGVRTVSDEISSLDLQGDEKLVVTSGGTYRAGAVVLATGSTPRHMGVPGEKELYGKGVSYCATCDGNFFRGKDVIVYGGANTAVQDALYLAGIARSVTVVYRGEHMRATAVYTDAAESAENVRFVYRSVIDRVLGDDGHVTGAVVRDLDSDETREIPASAIFVAIGSVPSTGLFAGQVALDGDGYAIAGEDCATSLGGVFVAGDIRTKPLRQVVTAVSDGAVAGEAASAYLGTRAARDASEATVAVA